MQPTIRLLAIPPLLAITAACAPTAEQLTQTRAADDREIASALEGQVAGEPVECAPLDSTAANGPVVVGDSILIRAGSRTYRSQVRDTCPALRRDQIVVSVVYGSQVCRNDQFRLIDRGSTIPSTICRYNRFTPYERS